MESAFSSSSEEGELVSAGPLPPRPAKGKLWTPPPRAGAPLGPGHAAPTAGASAAASGRPRRRRKPKKSAAKRQEEQREKASLAARMPAPAEAARRPATPLVPTAAPFVPRKTEPPLEPRPPAPLPIVDPVSQQVIVVVANSATEA